MRRRRLAIALYLLADLAAPLIARGPHLLAPGVVATGDSESHATLSPEGSELYFLNLTPDFAHWTVVVTRRGSESWSAPEIAWFSGRFDDGDVSFAPDGRTIYFISNRPDEGATARPDTDLFRMRRTAAGWSQPERLSELSSPLNEWFPTQTADGTLYFGSERRQGNLGPEGTSDLWRAGRLGDGFAAPENLGPTFNGAGQEIEPWISADERTLVFAAKGRPDSLGSYDLYVSYRCGGAWTPPRPLGAGVNSEGWDFAGRSRSTARASTSPAIGRGPAKSGRLCPAATATGGWWSDCARPATASSTSTRSTLPSSSSEALVRPQPGSRSGHARDLQILAKMSLRSTAELIFYAVHNGLVEQVAAEGLLEDSVAAQEPERRGRKRRRNLQNDVDFRQARSSSL